MIVVYLFPTQKSSTDPASPDFLLTFTLTADTTEHLCFHLAIVRVRPTISKRISSRKMGNSWFANIFNSLPSFSQISLQIFHLHYLLLSGCPPKLSTALCRISVSLFFRCVSCKENRGLNKFFGSRN